MRFKNAWIFKCYVCVCVHACMHAYVCVRMAPIMSQHSSVVCLVDEVTAPQRHRACLMQTVCLLWTYDPMATTCTE